MPMPNDDVNEDAQDEIARIRKRKRGRNMLNRSGNTTDNLCFRYRFRDVFSRFRCCVYNGTGPLFVHVSVKFQLEETNVSAIVISGLHLRKHKKMLRKHVFSMFPLTYSGLLNGWWNLRKHKKPFRKLRSVSCFRYSLRLGNVLIQIYLTLAETF